MALLKLDGVDDRVVLALGSLNFAFGAGSGSTISWIGRKADDAGTETLLWVGVTTLSAHYGLSFTGNVPQLLCGTTSVQAPASIRVDAADGLVYLGVDKANGTVAPRWHKGTYSGGSWTFVHADSTATVANSGTPATAARIGSTHSPSAFFAGDTGPLAVAANLRLSDLQHEALVVELAAWDTAGFVALWRDPSTTPVQDTIGAADQTAITGTTVDATAIPWAGIGGFPPLGVASTAGISPGASQTTTKNSPNRPSKPSPRAKTTPERGIVVAVGVSPAASTPIAPPMATAVGIAPTASATTTTAQGAVPAAGVSPSAAAQVSGATVAAAGVAPTDNAGIVSPVPGSAVATGISPSGAVDAPNIRGDVLAVGIAPAVATQFSPGAVDALGIEPGASVPAGIGSAAASAVDPTQAQSMLATPGTAVAAGITPSETIVPTTPEQGVVVAVGAAPTVTVTVSMGLAGASGIAPVASTSVSTGSAVGQGLPPSSTSAVSPGIATASGIDALAGAILGVGVSAGVGTDATSSTIETASTGVAVAVGFTPRPRRRYRLTSGTGSSATLEPGLATTSSIEPDVRVTMTLTPSEGDPTTLTTSTRPTRTLEAT